MIYLLIGGAPSVGKTEAITRIAELLRRINFTPIAGTFPPTQKDFRVVMEGIDKNGKRIRILINSATDNEQLISKLKSFYDENDSVDFVISSVRDVFGIRDALFSIMNIRANDTVIEIPLGKVRTGVNRPVALEWYQNRLDNLIALTLSNSPFEII